MNEPLKAGERIFVNAKVGTGWTIGKISRFDDDGDPFLDIEVCSDNTNGGYAFFKRRCRRILDRAPVAGDECVRTGADADGKIETVSDVFKGRFKLAGIEQLWDSCHLAVLEPTNSKAETFDREALARDLSDLHSRPPEIRRNCPCVTVPMDTQTISKAEIAIGDIVEVVNCGQHYDGHEDWAEWQSLTRWKRCCGNQLRHHIDSGRNAFKAIAIATRSTHGGEMLVGLEHVDTGEQYIVGMKGLKRIGTPNSSGSVVPMETCWLRLQLPDGQVVETPRPGSEWQGGGVQEFERYEALIEKWLWDGRLPLIIRIPSRDTDDTVELDVSSDALRCWWHDFTGRRLLRASVLAYKRFERLPTPVSTEPAVYSHLANYPLLNGEG